MPSTLAMAKALMASSWMQRVVLSVMAAWMVSYVICHLAAVSDLTGVTERSTPSMCPHARRTLAPYSPPLCVPCLQRVEGMQQDIEEGWDCSANDLRTSHNE